MAHLLQELFNIAVRLSEQRDVVSLQNELKSILETVMPGAKIQLYQLFTSEGEKEIIDYRKTEILVIEQTDKLEAPTPINEFKGFERCIQAGAIIENKSSDQMECIYPITGLRGVTQILKFRYAEKDESVRESIINILTVYRNLLISLNAMELDGLTRLLNRQVFNRVMKNFSNQHQSPPESVANNSSYLAMIDIDRFKEVNDNHGHLIGDEILIHFSKLIKSSFRFTDYFFRYGGEEFAVIVVDIERTGANQIFENFLLRIRDYAFPVIGKLTATIGFTEIKPNDVAISTVENADRALYFGKSTGRNRVCFYNKLLQEGLMQSTEYETGKIEIFK